MKKLSILGGALLLSAIIFFGRVSYVLAENADFKANNDTICEGVYIDDVNIGGMTKEEAKKAVQDNSLKYGKTTVTVSANSKKSQITMAKLGYKIKADECIEKANNIGSIGNLIQRYKDISDAKNGKKIYESTYDIDESLIEKFVNEGCKACDCEPVEPKVEATSNKLNVVGKGQDGQVIDKADTIAKIKEALGKWDKKEVVVEAKVETKKPKITEESLKECTDVIADYTTTMTCKEDSKINIRRGTALVNGSLVAPGEQFSILKKMSPCDEPNGYVYAGAIINGKSGKALGGGICQVSTTLYNAALYAELQIDERKNHSRKASEYYGYAFDAMVDEQTSDLKFTNIYKTPIFIQGEVSGNKVNFKIYGKETRDPNRKIEFKSTKPSRSGRYEYSNLYKYITINGVQQGEPVLINKSCYIIG